MPSTLPSSSSITNSLFGNFGATRTTNQLKLIKNFVTSKTEIIYDPLWKTLPESQKLLLCSYLRYSRIHEDTLIHLKDSSINGPDVKLLILIKGTGELACGKECLPLDSQYGPCLGVIPTPVSVQRLIKHENASNKGDLKGFSQMNMMNTFQMFMERIHKVNETALDNSRPSVILHRGSHYLYLNCLDCQSFMEKLFDRQISHRILSRFHCQSLYRKRNLDLFTFPKDQPIILEGMGYNKIILTIRGTCQLKVNLDTIQHKRNDQDRTSECKSECDQDKPKPSVSTSECCHFDNVLKNTFEISRVGPLSFLGFLPHFVNGVKVQPLSVVALTKVRVLALDATEFIKHISSCPNIRESFEDLSSRQVQWLKQELPKHITKDEKEEKGGNSNGEMIEFPTSSVSDFEEIMNARAKKNPRTSRYKLLSEFKRLVRGEEQNEEEGEYEDLFLRFDFKDECMRELEKIIEQDWASNGDEDSDLAPFPSILLSRKLHGKTLPHIRQSHGYKNPFQKDKPKISLI